MMPNVICDLSHLNVDTVWLYCKLIWDQTCEQYQRQTDTHISQGCTPPTSPGASTHHHHPTSTSSSLPLTKHWVDCLPQGLRLCMRIRFFFVCVRTYCGLANCRLILLTTVSHRHSQRLLPHLPSFVSLPPPTSGILPAPEALSRHTHPRTQTSCLSVDLLCTHFHAALSGSTLPCPSPHFTPHPADLTVLHNIAIMWTRLSACLSARKG